MPQVLERSREPGLKINWPSSTSASGMRVTSCLLAQDADTHLSRNGNKKKERKENANAKEEQLGKIKVHVGLSVCRPTGRRLKRKKS